MLFCCVVVGYGDVGWYGGVVVCVVGGGGVV